MGMVNKPSRDYSTHVQQPTQVGFKQKLREAKLSLLLKIYTIIQRVFGRSNKESPQIKSAVLGAQDPKVKSAIAPVLPGALAKLLKSNGLKDAASALSMDVNAAKRLMNHESVSSYLRTGTDFRTLQILTAVLYRANAENWVKIDQDTERSLMTDQCRAGQSRILGDIQRAVLFTTNGVIAEKGDRMQRLEGFAGNDSAYTDLMTYVLQQGLSSTSGIKVSLELNNYGGTVQPGKGVKALSVERTADSKLIFGIGVTLPIEFSQLGDRNLQEGEILQPLDVNLKVKMVIDEEAFKRRDFSNALFTCTSAAFLPGQGDEDVLNLA